METTVVEKSNERHPGRPVEEARNKHFLSVWNGAKSRGEAAGRLGISKLEASARRAYLRARGYKIKAFPRGRRAKS